MKLNAEAKIVSSKLEFKPKATLKPSPPLPVDLSEVLRKATFLACIMVPAVNGDEYAENLTQERQRVATGIIRMKGDSYFRIFKECDMPYASEEEIIALMQSPDYRNWRNSQKTQDFYEDEYSEIED